MTDADVNDGKTADTNGENEIKHKKEKPKIGPYSMTEEILIERSENESSGRYVTQLYAGIVASVSSISFGTVLGWSSPAIRTTVDQSIHLQAIEYQTPVSVAWVASLGPLGCSLGIIVWSYFNVKFGPKKTMVIQSPMLFTTWMTMAFLRNEKIELAGRFFCGFFAISYRVCGETLLIDSVHRLNLQHMVIPYRACVYLGVVLSYTLGLAMQDDNFSLLNCIIVALHFFLLLYCPESPVFLFDKNLKKAEAALTWYRGRANIYTEMRNIKKDSDVRKVDPAAYKYMLYSKVVVKAIVIVIIVNLTQIFSGYYIFLYYNISLVRKFSNLHMMLLSEVSIDSSSDTISLMADSLILGFNMFISSVVSTWVHFRVLFGIKKPLLLSCILVTIILILMSIYFYLKDKKYVPMVVNNWTFFVLVNALVMAYHIGLSCISDIMLLDYTPNQVYTRAKLIVRFLQWLLAFCLTKVYFHATNALKGVFAMGCLASISFFGTIFVALFVIESKDKTLVQVQNEIGGNPIGNRGLHNVRYQKKTTDADVVIT